MTCKNDSNPVHSFGYCHSCVQRLPLLDRYPDLRSVLSMESIGRVELLKWPSIIKRVNTVCPSCRTAHDISCVSLIKQYIRNKSNNESFLYRCHTCSKEGFSKIRVETVLSVIDLTETTSKYGGLPENVKKGKVVAVCQRCSSKKDVKLSSVLHYARRHKKEGRDIIYNCLKCGNTREDVVIKNVESRLKQQKLGFKSGLEIAVENRLKSLGVKYQDQFPVGMYLWDFFLPDYGLLIEVNGEYWHEIPQNSARDKSKRTYAARYHPEYEQLTIPEINILNPNSIDKIILDTIGVSVDVKQEDFDFANVSITSTPLDKMSISFLDSYHYARSGRNSKRLYTAYLNNQIIGVCKFNPVTRKESASRLGLKCYEVFELDRLCIHPNYHKKNFASWFLSRVIKLFFKDNPETKALLSFSDPNFGHTGKIYEATNWKRDGKTKVSYHYVDKSGFHINKKRVYDIASKLRLTENQYVIKHQLEKFREPSKSRFVYYRR